MNANSVQSLIAGLFRDRLNSGEAPGSLRIAPPTLIDSTVGGYWYAQTDGRYDARTGGAAALNADFERSDDSFEVKQVITQRYPSKFKILPDALLRSMEQGDTSVVDQQVRSVMDYVYGNHVAATLASAASLTADSLDISVPTTDARKQLADMILEVQVASGLRPNMIYMGAGAVQAFLDLDEFQQGVAISGYTASGSAVRRTGASDWDYAAQWFASKLQLELVVEDWTGINASGTADFLAGASAVLAHTQPGGGRSALKTAHMGGDNGGLISVFTEQTKLPLTPGVGFAAQAQFAVEATEPTAGKFISLTLP